MWVTRREFLRQSTLIAVGTSVPLFLRHSALSAASQGIGQKERVLVVLQLTGGNDGLNTVVPYGDELYAKNRVALRIPQDQVLKIDDFHGLHPAMRALRELWDEGWVGIVQGVGYPNPNRSHFRSMDIWHTASTAERLPEEGWLGRAIAEPKLGSSGQIPALYLGPDRLPRALVGRREVPAIASLEALRLQMEAEVLQAAQKTVSLPRRDPTLQFLQRSALHAYTTSQQLQQLVGEYRPTVTYPNTGLGQRLKMIAQLITAGFGASIYYTSLDGFDTHAGQAPVHAALLQELSDAVAAFCRDLHGRGELDRVLLMTFSEFGRRVRENGSAGTDHGAAAPLFVVGGKVIPGLIGPHPRLDELDQGDLKFHTDFRQVYAAVLEDWLGIPSEPVLLSMYEKVKLVKNS